MKEIVVKIDDELYETITDPNKWLTPKRVNKLVGAVLHGKVLPKGHGRLIDANTLVDGFEDNYEFCEALNATPTLVEADKE